jgi:NodT family efflux transporter outer membrane factor (OMF) lipoprotein
MIFAAGLSLLALAVLASCAIGPDYMRPGAAVPVDYKEDKGWKVAQPKDETSRGPWWEVFDDPLLNSLEEQVNVSNQNIASAEARFRQAATLVQSARSNFFPLITANPSAVRSLRSSNVTTSGIPTGTNTVYNAPLTLAPWEIDVWGRIRRLVESNSATAQASAGDLEGVRLSMQSSLAQNYYLLRSMDRLKQLLDETIIAYRRSLALTTNQYESGVVSKADVFQAETQLKSTIAQAIDVGVQRAQAEHAIALLIGKPASDFSLPVLPLDALPPPVPRGLPSDLLERRPDIAAAERRVAAANAQIGVAKAAYFPTITLGGSIGYQSIDTSNWLTWPSRFWSLGPTVAQTIFDGGARAALNEQARAAYDQSVADYRQTVLTAFQQVEDNLATLRILEEEAAAQGDAVISARKSLEISLNQYKAGTVNYLTVAVIQAAVLINERSALNISSRRMAACVLLIQALGGGWSASQLPQQGEILERAKEMKSSVERQALPANNLTSAGK